MCLYKDLPDYNYMEVKKNKIKYKLYSITPPQLKNIQFNLILYLDHEGVQTVADSIRGVELSEHHSMRGCLPKVPHPELGSLKVGGVDHKLLGKREI